MSKQAEMQRTEAVKTFEIKDSHTCTCTDTSTEHKSKVDNETENNSSSSSSNQSCTNSPFHVSNNNSVAYSARSSASFSWERAHATDPLLVKWEEYKLLQRRINKIKRLKF